MAKAKAKASEKHKTVHRLRGEQLEAEKRALRAAAVEEARASK